MFSVCVCVCVCERGDGMYTYLHLYMCENIKSTKYKLLPNVLGVGNHFLYAVVFILLCSQQTT